jgi:short-subunit dehydrogenase/acyl dehydratase/acyl carrier protein
VTLVPTTFSSFAVGDVAIFERSFSPDDFAIFSRLSGDSNPLHHDEEHALNTQFGATIVPLHLLLAPLSRLAGMVFPGEPSLYLGHEVRAAQPVRYGESLRYSGRIEAVNTTHRVLTVRALALRGTTVVLDAVMRVQAAVESWNSESDVPIIHTGVHRRAIVTGASGAIGSAVALTLASRGWALLLVDRGDGSQRRALRSRIENLKCDVNFVGADLATESGSAALKMACSGSNDVEAVVHAASPGLLAPLDQLVAVNFSALKRLTSWVLPGMLARQKGRVLMIGSTAMLRALPGWEDYAAAKSMAAAFAIGLNGQYSAYGLRGLVLVPGYVATPFSDAFRGNAAALLPQEVAAAVADMIENPKSSALVLENGREAYGDLGFVSAHTPPVAAPSPALSAPDSPLKESSMPASSAQVPALVRRVLHLPQDTDLTGGGVGVTSGWDSLRQIEIILALEAELNIHFSSADITELGAFDALLSACQRKLSKV